MAPTPRAAVIHGVMAVCAELRVVGIQIAALGAARHRLRFAVAPDEQLPNERNAAGEGNDQEVFHQRRTLLELIVDRVGLRSFTGNDGADIFDEIDPALLAVAAAALFVATGRAFVAHRIVATLTEARDFAHRSAALRTFHGSLRNRRVGQRIQRTRRSRRRRGSRRYGSSRGRLLSAGGIRRPQNSGRGRLSGRSGGACGACRLAAGVPGR